VVIAVERPLTIAVAGAHSTGKSTFLARLAHALRQHDLQVATVADLGERALQIGLPILHSHTYTSTLWIMTQGISNEIATWAHVDVLLIDRPVPDALGYYLAALDHRGEPPDPDAIAHLRSIAAKHSVHYDLLYRTTLDQHLPLGTDKTRDRDRALPRPGRHPRGPRPHRPGHRPPPAARPPAHTSHLRRHPLRAAPPGQRPKSAGRPPTGRCRLGHRSHHRQQGRNQPLTHRPAPRRRVGMPCAALRTGTSEPAQLPHARRPHEKQSAARISSGVLTASLREVDRVTVR
jgi:AAA domain